MGWGVSVKGLGKRESIKWSSWIEDKWPRAG